MLNLSNGHLRYINMGLMGFSCLFVFMGFICLAVGSHKAVNLSPQDAIWGGYPSDQTSGQAWPTSAPFWQATGNAARSAGSLSGLISCSGMRDALWGNSSVTSDKVLKNAYVEQDEMREWKVTECEAAKTTPAGTLSTLTILFALSATGFAVYAHLTERAGSFVPTIVLVAVTLALCVNVFDLLGANVVMHLGGQFEDCNGIPDATYSSVTGANCDINTQANIGATSIACVNKKWSAVAPGTPHREVDWGVALYQAPTSKCLTANDGSQEDVLASSYMNAVRTARAGASMIFIAMAAQLATTAWAFSSFQSRRDTKASVAGGGGMPGFGNTA